MEDTTQTRIKRTDLQQMKILSAKLGISNVELFGILLENYKTVNSIKSKDLKPINLDCSEKKFKLQSSEKLL